MLDEIAGETRPRNGVFIQIEGGDALKVCGAGSHLGPSMRSGCCQARICTRDGTAAPCGIRKIWDDAAELTEFHDSDPFSFFLVPGSIDGTSPRPASNRYQDWRWRHGSTSGCGRGPQNLCLPELATVDRYIQPPGAETSGADRITETSSMRPGDPAIRIARFLALCCP